MKHLSETDPEIADAIRHEIRRQDEGLELIASENFVSEAVLEAMGSVFTNKYAEGYPGKRYYGGCEFADVVENLARDRAKALFGADIHIGLCACSEPETEPVEVLLAAGGAVPARSQSQVDPMHVVLGGEHRQGCQRVHLVAGLRT